jgi:hypothetical protein
MNKTCARCKFIYSMDYYYNERSKICKICQRELVMNYKSQENIAPINQIKLTIKEKLEVLMDEYNNEKNNVEKNIKSLFDYAL